MLTSYPMQLTSFSWVGLVAITCCAGAEDDLTRGNQIPHAALRAPVIAPVGPGFACACPDGQNDCTSAACDAPQACRIDPECLVPGTCDPVAYRCRVRFDASASVDMDGDPLTYVFQWGDGSPALHTPDAVVYHDFDRETVFTVLVRVIDIHGEESIAEQDVSIRNEYPSPPNFCDNVLRPCVVGDDCENGVCFSDGGLLE
ncbi:PKD domain-containing protein [Myxococcota bacterium]